MRLKSRPASFDRLTVVPILVLCWTTAHPQSTALTEGQVVQNAAVFIGVRIRAVSRKMAKDAVAVSNEAARSQNTAPCLFSTETVGQAVGNTKWKEQEL